MKTYEYMVAGKINFINAEKINVVDGILVFSIGEEQVGYVSSVSWVYVVDINNRVLMYSTTTEGETSTKNL